MKKFCIAALVIGSALSVDLGFGTSSAEARLWYWKEFAATYIKADSKDAEDQAFAKLAGTSDKKALTGKCYVCHGKKKKVRNTYGTALNKFLKKGDITSKKIKAEPEKYKKEIQEALAKVAKMHSDSKDKK